MRLGIALIVIGAATLTAGTACGVSWIDVGVVLLVVAALALAPEPRRSA